MFLSLEIAKNSLLNNQTAISVASNNIANAAVEGYTKQRVNFESGSYTKGTCNFLLGTGAEISSIDRVKNSLYDLQYRANVNLYSDKNIQSEALQQIENLFGTVEDDTGLKTSFNNFWSALQELSKLPENTGIRQSVIDSGVALSSNFNELAIDLDNIKEQYSKNTVSTVNDINSLINDLRTVNDRIGNLTVANNSSPNDLLDKRDQLIDELAKKMDIQVVNGDYNTVNIISNGHVVLQNNFNTQLNVTVGDGFNTSVTWADNGAAYTNETGELSGLLTITNNTINSYIDKLNQLANDYITAFNNLHSTGYGLDGSTGNDFFIGTDAKTIDVSSIIKNSTDKVAAASDTSSGNNDNAIALLNLNKNNIIDGTESPLDYYNGILSSVYQETSKYINEADSYKSVVDEISDARTNASGVNTNEETLSLMQYQQSYSASAKVIQTISSMFDDLMSILGD